MTKRDDLDAIRARGAEHERELEAGLTFLTIADLASRWKVSRSTVLAISRDELPYMEIGRGRLLKRRRYDPRAVAAFENRQLRRP